MQNSLLSSTLLDILSVLRHNEQFFTLDHSARQSTIKELKFTPNTADYLANVSKEMFIADLEEVVVIMLSSPYKNSRKTAISIIELLSSFFDHQIEADLEKMMNSDGIKHHLLIQSPVRLDSEMKEEIRLAMHKKHPEASPIFVVNKKLIGGLRIYINGHVEDLSWQSKINILTSLKQ